MNRQTFRLIILISLAHALVHVFELALPSVEQMIGDEFSITKKETGWLGTVWRFPFGAGALLAGLMVDRWGSKRMLIFYLLGCGVTAIAAAWAPDLSMVTFAMFSMGCFASIYHPAGLSAISRATSAKDRGKALGWHGIFGSAGIASAPFIAGVVFGTTGLGWRQYYMILVIPAIMLAVMLALFMKDDQVEAQSANKNREHDADESAGQSTRGYFQLICVGVLQGFIYAGYLHFLPRYLGEANIRPEGMSEESFGNCMTAMALVFGIFGQAVAGRLSRPGHLENLLCWILWGNVLPLLLMATATGYWRIAGACLMAFVLFMSQPAYNSLLAQYVPPHRRSLGYGFNNFVSFGLGSLGAKFIGMMTTDWSAYGSMAIVAGVAGFLGLWLPRSLSVPQIKPDEN